MIDRDEIDEMAKQLGVNVSDVQRDYVFGWLLAGIYSESKLRHQLILKGGNCLRKAYFPFGRFSGDLDFSTLGTIDYNLAVEEINRVCLFVQNQTGVRFDTSKTVLRPKQRIDPSLRAVEGKVYFLDFYGARRSVTISIRVDVTEFDRLYLPVQTRRLIHAYSDYDKCQSDISCVKLEEQLAAKLKCLLQRRHVADLFDFVFSAIIHPEYEINRSEILNTFLRKTIFGRDLGAARNIFLNLPIIALKDFWSKYIVCPTQSGIAFQMAGKVFSDLVMAIFPEAICADAGVRIFPPDFRNPIMDAAHTQTVLAISYKGFEREVEPYSLVYKIRKDGVGQEYLYVYDRTGGSTAPGVKALVASEVDRIEATDIKFEPQFPIELKKAGEAIGSLYFSGKAKSSQASRAKSTRRRPTSKSSYKYTFKCAICEKRFYRNTYSTKLAQHKDKYGNRCIGRTCYLV